MKRILTGLAVFGLLAGADIAHAAPLGTISTSDGLLFSFSNSPSATDLDSDGLSDDLLYTLTLDTSGYTGASTDYIAWVSPNGVFHDGITQDSAPDASWTFHDGAANNNDGCNDNLASGKWCSQTASANTVLDGSFYTWTWTVDPNGAFIDPPHLQAAWFDTDGNKVNAISEDFVATGTGTGPGGVGPGTGTGPGGVGPGGEIPEPASMLLLGSGLAASALRLRRKQK